MKEIYKCIFGNQKRTKKNRFFPRLRHLMNAQNAT